MKQQEKRQQGAKDGVTLRDPNRSQGMREMLKMKYVMGVEPAGEAVLLGGCYCLVCMEV
jgi:hypothetical protein